MFTTHVHHTGMQAAMSPAQELVHIANTHMTRGVHLMGQLPSAQWQIGRVQVSKAKGTKLVASPSLKNAGPPSTLGRQANTP